MSSVFHPNYYMNDQKISQAKSGTLTIKSTQSFLECIQTGRNRIRETKKAKMIGKIEELERKTNLGKIHLQ